MEWFVVWDRPEYKEWASAIPEGYLLHIIRKEKGQYLAAQAKLLMAEKGLPGFELIEQCYHSTESAAHSQIQSWKSKVNAYAGF